MTRYHGLIAPVPTIIQFVSLIKSEKKNGNGRYFAMHLTWLHDNSCMSSASVIFGTRKQSANRFRRGSASEYTRTTWTFTEAICNRHSELEATETFRIESFIFSSVMTHGHAHHLSTYRGHAYVAVLGGMD